MFFLVCAGYESVESSPRQNDRSRDCLTFLEEIEVFINRLLSQDRRGVQKTEQHVPRRGCVRTLLLSLVMSKNPANERESDKPAETPVEGIVNIHAAAKVGSSAHVRVRMIQHSPAADPKLVEEARRFARELKEKEGPKEDPINPNPEAPLIVQP